MRKYLYLSFGLLFVVWLSLYLYVAQAINHAQSRSAETQIIFIPNGTSATKIYDILAQKQLVNNLLIFKYLIYRGSLVLKAGEYELSPQMPLGAIVKALASGRNRRHKVTIPEGLTIAEIAQLLEGAGLTTAPEFIAAANSPELCAQYDVPANTMEGYLFPDTYFFTLGQRPEALIGEFFNQFKTQINQELLEQVGGDKDRLHQKLILASIVEGEAATNQERPIIARVFLNRLERGMRLESCATIQFALGTRKKRIFEADLQIDSPYNTYRHKGLPPGPINNPGRASIEAVFFPVANNYLYFVSKQDGTHAFAKSAKEHYRNVRQYLRR